MPGKEHMDDAQIEALVAKTAEATARRVVAETFLTLGVDATTPAATMQMQLDMQHLRAWRTSVATVKRQGLITSVGIIVLGVLGMIWTSFTHPSP